MKDKSFKEACTEILLILRNIDISYSNAIPKGFIDFLEHNKLDSYFPNIDFSKEMKYWNINKKTKSFLSMMYLKYWGTPDKKREYLKLLQLNEQKYQNELRTKYNADNLFKKHEKTSG